MTPLSTQPSREWAIAKRIVDKADKPSLERIMKAPKKITGSHGKYKQSHELTVGFIKLYFFNKVEVFYKWAVCSDCKETRWEKFIAFDAANGLVYEKYLIKKGEIVETT